jgi:hypothetical protein
MLLNQSVSIVGKRILGSSHFQKLVALRPFRYLLRESAALFSMLPVFRCFLHVFSSIYQQRNAGSGALTLPGLGQKVP